MSIDGMEYFDCTDLQELESQARDLLRLALKQIGALPLVHVPFIKMVEIDDLQKKIANYRLEIKRRCTTQESAASTSSNGADVFISYAGENTTEAEAVAARLREAGLSVFFAPASIRSSDSYVDSLNRGLAACRSAVIVWSSAAVSSLWVKNEVNYLTIRRNRGDVRLEIIRLEPVEVPSLLVDLQHRDAFSRGIDAVATDLAADLKT